MVKPSNELSSAARGSGGRRAQQAEQTRAEILGAARRLFVSQGYASTSVKEIAAEAGASVQTVYDSVGSKAELVRRLNDVIDAEAGIGEFAARAATETDPTALVGIAAQITCRILERCGDIVRISIDGATSEPALAGIIDEGGRRHRDGAHRLAARLADLGHLAPGVAVGEAATSIAALSDIRLALVLLDDHGLDLARIEHWMTTMAVRAVLTD